MVKWGLTAVVIIILIALTAAAVIWIRFKKGKMKESNTKPVLTAQLEVLPAAAEQKMETKALEDELTLGIEPETAEDTAVLEDSRTQELPDLTQLFAEEAPEGLKDSKTEMVFPDSVYVDLGCSSMKGTRDYQQDSVDAVMDEKGQSRVCAVLCDGMGGLEGGEIASALAVSRMLKELKTHWENYPDAILDAVDELNEEIRELKDETTGKKLQAGTTLTAVAMEGNQMYLCSVGDSRIYLYRRGILTQLTRDHIYGVELDKMVASGEMTELEALDHPKRGALTSYLGISRLDKICYNRTPFELRPSDVVLMCSDGLYRCLSNQEICLILSQSMGSMQLASRRLCATAVSKPGRHDNTSAILICYKGEKVRDDTVVDPIP